MSRRKPAVRRAALGIDENGFGPQLGPLVATAACVHVPADLTPEALFEIGQKIGIDDSKNVSRFGKMCDAESLSLAIFEAERGAALKDVDALLSTLSVTPLATLQARCPNADHRAQCFGEAIALPAFGGSADEGKQRLAALEEEGIQIARVRSEIACARRIAQARDAGLSKPRLNLVLFESLLSDAHEAMGEMGEVDAVCGVIGGIRKYAKYFDVLAPSIEVSPMNFVTRLGRVRFEYKADARFLEVALASMVGKYVRELTMDRILRFYRSRDPALPAASGYHDAKTKLFVEGSAPLRARLALHDDCFFR